MKGKNQPVSMSSTATAKLPRVKVYALALAYVIALVAIACSQPTSKRSLNVMIITVDTLRADHLGCYGYHRPTSPNIDAFAHGATLYRRSFATAPWTVPTHASLFTGKTPFEHGAHTFKSARQGQDLVNPLHKDHFTLAEMFSAEDVETAAFVANTGFLGRRFQLDQGFETYEVTRRYAEKITQLALAWLEEHTEGGFFLFLNYIDVHRPYNTHTPASFLDTPAVVDRGELVQELYEQVMPGENPVPAELAQKIIDQYDTAIANADIGIGELFEQMKALEIYDNTLIVLTSDHGEYFGEHLLVEHSKDIYMEATHVPLIIKYPGQSEGSVSDRVISSVDIPGMILDRLPAEVAKPYLDRFSARPGKHPVLIENYYTRGGDLWNKRWGHRFNRVRRAVIDWPYKIIQSSDGAHELYDLSVDIAESNNLYTTEADVAKRLFATLAEYHRTHPRANARVKQKPLSSDEIEQLRVLGYLEAGDRDAPNPGYDASAPPHDENPEE
jgi:arylsulfatase A-like enzyme